MRYTPGLTLTDVFRTALDVLGPGAPALRHRLVVLPARLAGRTAGDTGRAALDAAGATPEQSRLMLGGNFARLFPVLATDH